LTILLLAVGLGFGADAPAQLYSRAGGTMVYDSDLDITWLADANYAATQYEQSCGEIGAPDGKMTWPEATRWAAGLVYAGYDDWRLPTTPTADASCDEQDLIGTYGFHCTGGEMGHLFYGDIGHGLGGVAGESIIRVHNDNFHLFRNFSSFGAYWLGTEFAPLAQIALNFHTRNGFANANSKSVFLLAWAVRDGDVVDVPPDPGSKNPAKCK
jgi:hypothetical protein